MVGLGLLITPRVAVGLSLALIVWLPQVLTDSDPHSVEKRNIGVLARTGQLPYLQGKRYMASLARTGSLPVYLQKKLHPMMTHLNQQTTDKRYVGSLLRAGGLPKRDMQEETLEKLRSLEAETRALETALVLESQLNVELLKEKLLSGEVADEGGFPEKRSVEALARAGYLPVTPNSTAPRGDEPEEVAAKRGVATLAKNGMLKSITQRGGIGSLARNNLLPQKREDEDTADELEELIEELMMEDPNKRNIGSVARNFNLPSGKRNIGSVARGGAYSRFSGKRNELEDDFAEDKRNVASLLRGRMTPLQEGKRYLGSIARNQKVPFAKKDFDMDENKRMSPMALAKNWNQPDNQRVYGKRYWPSAEFQTDEGEVENVAKRYVAALLRQGPLPVGTEDSSEVSERPEPEKEPTAAEEKRHLGSVKASIHKRSSEKEEVAGNKRNKREAFLPPGDEYPMPVYQNSDLFDYDDLVDVMSGAVPQKRFLGRIPQMGRRPKTTPNPGRRRPTLRVVSF